MQEETTIGGTQIQLWNGFVELSSEFSPTLFCEPTWDYWIKINGALMKLRSRKPETVCMQSIFKTQG